MERLKRFLLHNWQYFGLVLALALAFYVRYVPYTTNKYINLDDPYYLYKMANYYVTHGNIPAVDYQSYYPVGRPLPLYADQAFLYILVGWLKMIGGFFFPAFTAYKATFLYPAIFGALQVVPMFLLVSALSRNKTAGLISAAFYGVLPASLSRTLAGFAYKEGFGLFFLLFSLYFLVEAIERKNHLFSLLAGCFLFLMGLTWGGVQLGQLFLLLYAFSAIIFELKKPVASASLIACWVSLFLGFLPSPHNIQATVVSIAVLVLALFLAKNHLYKRLGIVHVAVLFVILYFVFPAKVSSLMDLAANFNMGGMEKGLSSTVAQNKITDWSDFGNDLGLSFLAPKFAPLQYLGAIFISAAGAVYIAYEFILKDRKVDELKLFVLLFFLYGIWFGKGAVRLIVGTAISVSIMAGYFFGELLSKDRSFLKLPVKRWYFLIVLALSLGSHVYLAYGYSQGTRTTMNDAWQEALEWLGSHSPQDSVVFSWWDYGYIIQVIANRTTVVDPRNLFAERDVEAALFLTAPNESSALHFNQSGYVLDFPTAMDYIRKYNISYVVLDADMVGKYSAVSKIASDGTRIDSFLLYSLESTNCVDSSCSQKVSKFGPIEVFTSSGSGETTSAFFVQGNQRMPISRSCTVPGDGPCVLLAGNTAVLGASCYAAGCTLSPEPTGSIFFKLWFLDTAGLGHFQLAHQNSFVKVYKVV